MNCLVNNVREDCVSPKWKYHVAELFLYGEVCYLITH
jgi:hypothetical protein